jgi:hypothetical protein
VGNRLLKKLRRGLKLKLVGSNEIDWNPSVAVPGFTPRGVYFGQGNPAQAMQIATGTASSSPSRTQLKNLYSDRKGKLPISLMLAIEIDDQVIIFGPDPDSETLFLRPGNAINFLNAVLAEPEESLSYQRAISIRRALQTTNISGFTNNGLFASHYIRTSAPAHPSWEKCLEDSKKLVDLRNKNLIEGLGFEITANPANTHVLRAKGQDKRVVAVLLDQNESFDGKSARFQASPVEWGLNIATNEGAPWLIAIRDSQIRLYPAKDGVGVGQKSQVETYFEIDLLTIDEEKAALLPLIFSADALSENGTADELLRESQKFAAALGTRLRERVYELIVPQLATDIANQLRDKGHNLDSAGLQLAYGLTLRVLFRLLFQAYAEDRGLLPAGRNERFDKNSLKDRAADLIKHGPDFDFGDSSSIWFDHMQIWNAIDQGSPEMQIPAYNGGLFGTDEKLHPEGFLIRSLNVPDKVMGPALRALVIDDNTEDGVPGMVDFRSLSVREFGTIYEGLLESSLSVAEQDLTVDKKGAWVPAQKGEAVLAKKGQVYFHSASGERKATGSYYTPSFVVDHLIERSVEPALKNHLGKVQEKIVAGDQAAAYDLFFDFRVADLAMGSGHFLVAAIDKIETVMRSFLLEPGNEIEGVEAELKRLEDAAKSALGPDEAAYAEIERASLLRRQIARRCIYGLDINPLAVELSRLAIWIHTFVPGLPMSSLEHGLVCANSLTGIGSIEEAMQALLPNRSGDKALLVADPLEFVVEDALVESKKILLEVSSADEATKGEVKHAYEQLSIARQSTEKIKKFFDLAIGNRNAVVSVGEAVLEPELLNLHNSDDLHEFISQTSPAHFPLLFPEVFLRLNPGFDALLGNPPWEKVEADLSQFLTVLYPGFKSLQQKAREELTNEFLANDSMPLRQWTELKHRYDLIRKSIASADFPGFGVDHPDFAKAFSWRYEHLLRAGGSVALVLPKTIFSGRAMQQWRKKLFGNENKNIVQTITNNGGWVFENVHQQKEFVFFSSSPEGDAGVFASGPFSNRNDWAKSTSQKPQALSQSDLGDSLEFPSAPSPSAWRVFKKLRRHHSFQDSEYFCKTIYETDASKQKYLFDFNLEEATHVYKGASFDLWTPFTGVLYATTQADEIRTFLSQKINSLPTGGKSKYPAWSEKMLPFDFERIAYRWTTNSTNTRTMICCLVPKEVVLTNGCPYLVPFEDHDLNLGILGILSSRIFDWWCRRFVEGTMRQTILNAAPFPELADDDLTSLASVSRDLLAASATARGHLEAKLDAIVSRLYGLDRDDLKVIFETFHKTWEPTSHYEQVVALLEETETINVR